MKRLKLKGLLVLALVAGCHVIACAQDSTRVADETNHVVHKDKMKLLIVAPPEQQQPTVQKAAADSAPSKEAKKEAAPAVATEAKKSSIGKKD